LAERSGKPAKPSGKPAKVSGKPAELSGRPAKVSGKPAKPPGKPAELSGKPAKVSGILANASGNLSDASGNLSNDAQNYASSRQSSEKCPQSFAPVWQCPNFRLPLSPQIKLNSSVYLLNLFIIMEIKDLKPALLWQYFDRITQIPRPSKKEDRIVGYLLEFAAQNGLKAEKDGANNVLIRKPASKGRENLKPVILQAHVDMVCEKNADVKFNFDVDPVRTHIEDGWVKAKGTTLGGDDGIGVAAMLALLSSKDVEHGQIDCLFTTDEETGLTGAESLNPDFLSGGDIMINLDSEEWGEFCIGCAGGRNTLGIFHYVEIVPPEAYYWFEVTVDGLQGGHSGTEIHAGFGNANKILIRYLWSLLQECNIILSSIDGGNLHNAIPREAKAIAGVPQWHKDLVSEICNVLQANLSEELAYTDKNVRISVRTVDRPKTCIDATRGKFILKSLRAMPHGVMGMSHAIPGLVETSTNFASIKMTAEASVTVTTSQRSSYESLRNDVGDQIKSLFLLAGAQVKSTGGYPGWQPNRNSPILKRAESVYEELFSEKPKIIAIHAGLECGLFLKKNPKLDVISCGPTILGAHSPDERLEIESVGKWWEFLLALLKSVPTK
jgi:dipeptidase D